MMALIERHPDIEDYFVEMSLAEIEKRNGIADLFENSRLVVVKDYRLDFDFEAIAMLNNRLDDIPDQPMRRQLKKLVSPKFFSGATPEVSLDGATGRETLRFEDPVRQALFDDLGRGDRALFERASRSLKSAHDEINRIFKICFPVYDPFRLIASIRLTETLFENLHWDNHSIDDDFHQARIFCNMDTRRRIWSVSHNFIEFARQIYKEHDLSRFAGQDPNLMVNYINGDVLGGTRKTWMDSLPRHRVAFEPGEVWLGESRMISHQIYYGERAMVYMWFVHLASMNDTSRRFNHRVEELHAMMRSGASAADVKSALASA